MNTNLKNQLQQIANKVNVAEKMAEKKIQSILKGTEQFRGEQLKKVQGLVKQARSLKQSQILKGAEKVAKDLESRASEGFGLLLSKLNVPSRQDLERLSKRVTQLQKKLDELEKAKSSTRSNSSN